MKKKHFLEINQKQLKESMQLPTGSSVVMLHLLRFKEQVAETGLSG